MLFRSHNFYQSRSPEFYIRRAAKYSDMLAELFTAIFKGEEVPEIMYKRCDGLLALQRKTDPVVFEHVCRYALENNVLTLGSIKRVINNRAYMYQLLQSEGREEINKTIKHTNIRGKKYYTG